MTTITNPRVALSTAAIALSLIAAACAPAATPAATKAAAVPTIKAPTAAPLKPTTAPAKPTVAPTIKPTLKPTEKPTLVPTVAPTAVPTAVPEALGKGQMVGLLQITPSQAKTLTSSGSDKPKTGNVFLSFDITIENTSKTDSLTIDPAMLMLMDPTGASRFTTLSLKSVTNALTTQTLKPGAKLSGIVVFEVPKDTKGLELTFRNTTHEAAWALGA